MKWWKILMSAMDCLKAGKQLENSAVWKNRATAANLVAVIFASLISIGKTTGKLQLDISDEDQHQIAVAVVILFGMFNSFMHLGTSASVGLSSLGGDSAAPGKPDDAAKP